MIKFNLYRFIQARFFNHQKGNKMKIHEYQAQSLFRDYAIPTQNGVVFEKKSEKRVVLITGYPVFYISAKKDLEKDYQNYLKNPMK